MLHEASVAPLVRRRRRRGRVALRPSARCARGSRDRPVFYLATPPSTFQEVAEELAGAGSWSAAPRRREAVRHRPRVRARAERAADRDLPRRAALPDRPLPREGARAGHHVPPLRERPLRAGLEPRARRVRPDHHGGGLRSRGPRRVLRPGRRDPRRRPEPPPAGARARRDGASVGRRGRHPAAPESTSSGRCRQRTRRSPCAVSTSAIRDIEGVEPGSDTETFVALRFEIENWRWAGVPILVRAGEGASEDRDGDRHQTPARSPPALGGAPARLSRARRHRPPHRPAGGRVDLPAREDARQGGLATRLPRPRLRGGARRAAAARTSAFSPMRSAATARSSRAGE